jgi:hypothetical protein
MIYTEDILLALKGRILLVGNGTILNPYQHRVDGYDVVIRFNNYRIKGFEELIGTKTTLRCTTGWNDVENRNEVPEISPFTLDAKESSFVDLYNKFNQQPLIMAKTRVHDHTDIPNPSTGLALVLLFSVLKRRIVLLGFDSFATPNLGSTVTHTTHLKREYYIIQQEQQI